MLPIILHSSIETFHKEGLFVEIIFDVFIGGLRRLCGEFCGERRNSWRHCEYRKHCELAENTQKNGDF